MSAYAATVSFKDFISNGLHHFGAILPPPAVKTLESIRNELESFQNFVERLNSSSRTMMSDSLGIIAERIRESERSFRSGNLSLLGYGKGSHSLIDSLKNMQEEYSSTVLEASSSSNSKIVGLRDEKIKLKEDIVNLRVQRSVFTLFGTAGIGKTTLAREIFEDLDLSEWFDCRAWVTVGTEWNFEEITEAIRGQIGLEDEDLKIWLESKRYLIVLDDVWKVNVEFYLRSTFPDNKNGSRVLLTSRIKLTGYHGSLMFRQFEKRFLDKEESWHLLCELVFDGNNCPSELVEAGKKIAEKCDGLPITIVTVADLLSKDEEEPESLWFDVAEQKKHHIFTEAYDQMSEVLYPSYEDLIDKFKSCFLYMGVFPLKCEIPASKLINLWIAEEVNVIPSTSMTSTTEFSLESHAANVLQLLDYQCLIKVHLRSTSASPHMISPKIKTCSLHSSWWHFCQREARETNFFRALDCFDDAFEEGIDCQSRLSFHNNVLFALKDVYDSTEENCATTVQSLLCFGPYNQYMVPMCFGLKLLVRLDALNIRFYEFPIEVLELVKLRYLSLTCNGKLPPSVSKLGELQYLIVHRDSSIKSNGAVSNYPMKIWEMETLKHLQVLGCDLPDLGDTSLPNLSTLSGVSTASCAVLKRVPNLRKLGIIIERRSDGSDPLCFFDHISQLIRLESLKCVIVNPEWKFDVYPPVGSFPCLPLTLKKLSLSGLGYHWDEMSNIASLPNLEILKLKFSAFRGPKWEVGEHGFQKLCFLLIEDADLVILKCDLESFKCLKVLKIGHCYKLKELHLGKLENIEKIEVIDSNPLIERIVQGNLLEERLKVGRLLMHSSWNSKEKESRR